MSINVTGGYYIIPSTGSGGGTGGTINVVVQNSDGSFSVGYTQNGTFTYPDATANTYNSLGSFLTGVTVPSAFSGQSVISDSVVRNSDSSYDVLVPATEELVLPLINVFNTTGLPIQTGYPSVKDYTIPDLSILNSCDDPIDTLIFPQIQQYTIPDVGIVNQDGQSATTCYSGVVYTNFTSLTSVDIVIRSSEIILTSFTTTERVNYVVEDSLVLNSGGTYQVSVPATSGHVIPNSFIVNENSDLIGSNPATEVFEIPSINTRNTDGDDIGTFVYPANTYYIIPDVDVINNDGQSATTPYSGSVYTSFSGQNAQSEIENTDGQSLSSVTISAGTTATTVISDSVIRNSDSSYTVLVPATSGHTILDSRLLNSSGGVITSISLKAGVDNVILDYKLFNSDGKSVQPTLPIPTNRNFYVPDVDIINNDGQSATTPYSGSVYTSFSGQNAQSEIENTDGQSLSSVTISAGTTATTVISDSVIQNTDGSYLVSVPATSGHTIPNIRIVNEQGQTLENYRAAIDYTVPTITLKNEFDDYIGEILGGFTQFTITSSTVQNSDASYLVSIPAVSSHTLSDINILDGNSNVFQTYPSATAYTIPDFNIINSDGQSASSVNYSGTVYTEFSGSSGGGGDTGGTELTLTYKRPFYKGQEISYFSGDAAWHYSSGTYDYTSTGNTVQELDYSSPTPFYRLKYNNTFGNKFRFTTDTGDSAIDGLAQFSDTSFSASTWSYIIDHLTGLGWFREKIGYNDPWEDAITSANTFSWSGMTDWRIPSTNEVEATFTHLDSYYQTENILIRTSFIDSGTDIQFWLGETQTNTTTNAFIYNDSSNTSRRSKASGSLTGTYVCRTHYDTADSLNTGQIAYQRIQPSSNGISYVIGDTHHHITANTYCYEAVTAPTIQASVDYLATEADIRGSYYGANGDGTDSIAPTYLKENNAFGNKYRFTDSIGNPSDESSSHLWDHVDFVNHSFAGAESDYVIDHLTGLGYYTNNITNGTKYNMNVTVPADGATWEQWCAYVNTGLTVASYSDWRMLTPEEASSGFHIDRNSSIGEDWAQSIVSTTRRYTPFGTSASSSGVRCAWDSSNGTYYMGSLSKAGSSSFLHRISYIMVVRSHY